MHTCSRGLACVQLVVVAARVLPDEPLQEGSAQATPPLPACLRHRRSHNRPQLPGTQQVQAGGQSSLLLLVGALYRVMQQLQWDFAAIWDLTGKQQHEHRI